MKELCLVSFEYGKFMQCFEIVPGKFNIGHELIKFICYLEDHSMTDYFKGLVANKQFSFDESFFIKELKNKTHITEVNNCADKSDYKYVYIIDLDCEFLCYIKYLQGLINYSANTFEQISEYPYEWKGLI